MRTKDIDSIHSRPTASHRRLSRTSTEPPPGIPRADPNSQGTEPTSPEGPGLWLPTTKSRQVSLCQADGSLIPDISSPRHLRFHLLNVSKYTPAPAFPEPTAAETKAAVGPQGTSKHADAQTEPSGSRTAPSLKDALLSGTSGAPCAWQSNVQVRSRILLRRSPAGVPAPAALTAAALPSPVP